MDRIFEIGQWVVLAFVVGALIYCLWSRSVHLYDWEVTREEDAIAYWLIIAVEAGLAAFLLYRVLAG
ncbi:MAG TPA: hypothetical protein VK539_25520 [Myxococcaceae bacterium]|nr:hypothetical protein [Myxococcaceae bacterium]